MTIVPEGGDKKLREIEASGLIVLACRSCGELTILLGHTRDWYREERPTFACCGGGCGLGLTLADRVGEVRLDTAGLAPVPAKKLRPPPPRPPRRRARALVLLRVPGWPTG